MGTLFAIAVGIVVAAIVLRKLEGAAAAAGLVLTALGVVALLLLELGRPREAVRLGAPVLGVVALFVGGAWVLRRHPRVPGLLAGSAVGALLGVPLFVAVLKLVEHLGWSDAEQYPTVRIAVSVAVVSLAAVAGGWVGWRRSGGRAGPGGN
jgi:hypothetical protein